MAKNKISNIIRFYSLQLPTYLNGIKCNINNLHFLNYDSFFTIVYESN